MYGAVLGDIIGSTYEWHNAQSEEFDLFPSGSTFTDDTVPVALEAFFESDCYEDAIRKAISVGGDSDTIACMTGGIAQAYYKKIPEHIFNTGMNILDTGLKQVLNEFEDRYKVKR